jgi:hypothetical protein
MRKNIRFKDIFKGYDPPDGGMHGLNQRLDREDTKDRISYIPKLLGASTLCAVLFFVFIISPRIFKQERDMFLELVQKTNNPIFIKNGYFKNLDKGVFILADSGARTEAVPVETKDKNIKFYIIDRKGDRL